MQSSKCGAHLPLQTGTRALDATLQRFF